VPSAAQTCQQPLIGVNWMGMESWWHRAARTWVAFARECRASPPLMTTQQQRAR
jgi:hypothetical protein